MIHEASGARHHDPIRGSVLNNALAAQFRVVVDFAVEDDDRIAVIGNDGLVAGFQVNNLETRRAERYEICFEDTLLVRPAVNERIRRGLNAACSRFVILLSEACDSTQLRSPHSVERD